MHSAKKQKANLLPVNKAQSALRLTTRRQDASLQPQPAFQPHVSEQVPKRSFKKLPTMPLRDSLPRCKRNGVKSLPKGASRSGSHRSVGYRKGRGRALYDAVRAMCKPSVPPLARRHSDTSFDVTASPVVTTSTSPLRTNMRDLVRSTACRTSIRW